MHFYFTAFLCTWLKLLCSTVCVCIHTCGTYMHVYVLDLQIYCNSTTTFFYSTTKKMFLQGCKLLYSYLIMSKREVHVYLRFIIHRWLEWQLLLVAWLLWDPVMGMWPPPYFRQLWRNRSRSWRTRLLAGFLLAWDWTIWVRVVRLWMQILAKQMTLFGARQTY